MTVLPLFFQMLHLCKLLQLLLFASAGATTTTTTSTSTSITTRPRPRTTTTTKTKAHLRNFTTPAFFPVTWLTTSSKPTTTTTTSTTTTGTITVQHRINRQCVILLIIFKPPDLGIGLCQKALSFNVKISSSLTPILESPRRPSRPVRSIYISRVWSHAKLVKFTRASRPPVP